MSMNNWSRYEIYFGLALWVLMTGMILLFGIIIDVKMGIPFTFARFCCLELFGALLCLPILLARHKVISLFSSLFWPEAQFDRPQPIYSKPEALRAQNQFPEAIQAYADIAQQYPDLARAYVEIMDIYDLVYHDRTAVQKTYDWAKDRVSPGPEREKLEQAYREIVRS